MPLHPLSNRIRFNVFNPSPVRRPISSVRSRKPLMKRQLAKLFKQAAWSKLQTDLGEVFQMEQWRKYV